MAPETRIQAPASISPATFRAILLAADSPAAPEAFVCYEVIRARGIDPGVALAFFAHESSYGTAGAATQTRNWGNLRRGRRAYRVAAVPGSSGSFAWYRSWATGAEDWADLLLGPIYIGAGRTTVETVLPVYAPSSDDNDPAGYAATVRALLHRYRAAEAELRSRWGPIAPADWGYAIPRAWAADAGRLGHALGPEETVGPAGAKVAMQVFAGGVIIWDSRTDRAQIIRGGTP
jgi:hypothetical protein